MHFIILVKLRNKLDKKTYERIREIVKTGVEGIKPYGWYFMIGNYDAVWHVETDDFTAATKLLNELREIGEVNMFLALSLDETAKIL